MIELSGRYESLMHISLMNMNHNFQFSKWILRMHICHMCHDISIHIYLRYVCLNGRKIIVVENLINHSQKVCCCCCCHWKIELVLFELFRKYNFLCLCVYVYVCHVIMCIPNEIFYSKTKIKIIGCHPHLLIDDQVLCENLLWKWMCISNSSSTGVFSLTQSHTRCII